MKMPELPELPEPDGSATIVTGHMPVGTMTADITDEVDAWSRERVVAYALQYGEAVREACAKSALTEAEASKIIRILEDAKHLLSAIPRDPELDDSLAQQVRELEEARQILKGKM